MIAIHSNKLHYHIGQFEDQIDDHVNKVQKAIGDWLKTPDLWVSKTSNVGLSTNQKKYLRLLKKELHIMVKGDTKIITEYKLKFDKIISETERKANKEGFVTFKNVLLDLMGYSYLRSTYTTTKNPLFVDFYQTFGIRSCVFCNSQLTIVAEEEGGTLRAKFQVDHFIDKSSYPCFSISFFNLYPVCASCNNKKGIKPLNFQLYSSSPAQLEKSNFQFSIDRESVAQYRLSRDESLLKVSFDDNGSGMNDMFAIEGIFKTQVDLAAEIILKADMYNESYKTTLQESFDNLYGKKGNSNSINFNRIILGNYSDPKDIHKRPMAKFTQDIAKQLKLI